MKIYWVNSRVENKDHFFDVFQSAVNFIIKDTIDYYGRVHGITDDPTSVRDLRYSHMNTTPSSNGNYEVFFEDITTGTNPYVVSYIHSAVTED